LKRKKQKLGWTILVIVVSVGMNLFNDKENSDVPTEESSQSEAADSVKTPAYDSSLERMGRFEILRNCCYVSDKYNDGDSFKVKTEDGRIVEVRLYFVDTAESRDKPYADHRERVMKQGQYFGGLSYEKTLSLGKKAKERAVEKLSRSNLTVYTVWEEVYDSGRYHAFVEVGRLGWWHEYLVNEGLARIHTKGSSMPSGLSERKRENDLEALERVAKRAGKGGWGM